MLTYVTETRKGQAAMAAAQDHLHGAAPLKLSHQISATGEAVVAIDGELDIATTDLAVSYVKQVIDQHHGPVIADLAGLSFCDAQGLSALLRMTGHAHWAGCSFQLASPSSSLVKILRITGLDRRFPTSRRPT